MTDIDSERMNDEYQEELRILRQSIKTSDWVQLNDYVVICMRHKQRGKSGYSQGDVFHGRPTLRLDLPFPHEGNVQVQDWVKEQNKIAQVVQAHLRKGRASRFERVNRRRKPAVFNVGNYVLVSRKRFKQLDVPKGATKDVMWYGPYLVTEVSSGGITARCSPTLGGEVSVPRATLQGRTPDTSLGWYRLQDDLTKLTVTALRDLTTPGSGLQEAIVDLVLW